MAGCLRVAVLLLLVTGTLTDDGFNLFDALDDPDPQPKPDKPAVKPPSSGGGLDLIDFFGPGGLDLLDAFGPGGRTFSDSDLLDVIGGDYKPEEGGGYQGGLLEKLNTIIKNQNQQLRLLKQLTPSSRFNDRRTR
uniref:CD99 antigen-like protein 2 isoform X2 n=1 Tax=Gasterosteus aculeatus aculeatus TaxID=481459 RepID=UPI001A9A0798|nr:CD99 antigen-like protein 2 isoform X2 [Gasterosteus aculeatus aculeatus]